MAVKKRRGHGAGLEWRAAETTRFGYISSESRFQDLSRASLLPFLTKRRCGGLLYFQRDTKQTSGSCCGETVEFLAGLALRSSKSVFHELIAEYLRNNISALRSET